MNIGLELTGRLRQKDIVMWSQKWMRQGNTLLSKYIKRRIALRKCDRRERIKINKIRRDSQEEMKKKDKKNIISSVVWTILTLKSLN